MLPLLLAGLGAAGQLGAAYLNKPKRYKLPIETMMAANQAEMLQGVNRSTANLGTSLAPALAARRLNTSGVGPSLLSRSSSEMTQGGLADLLRMRQGLQTQQSGLDQQYEEQKRGWISNLIAQLGQTAGQAGGIAEQESQLRELRRLLKELSQNDGQTGSPSTHGGVGYGLGYGPYGNSFPGSTDVWRPINW